MAKTTRTKTLVEHALVDSAPGNADDVLRRFGLLSHDQQKKFLDAALNDSAWRKPGAGVGGYDIAAKNRNTLKPGGGSVSGTEKRPDAKDDKIANAVRQDLKDAFRVGDDVLDQLVEIVEAATDAKAAGAYKNGFVSELLNYLAQYGGVFVGEEIDAVEALCNRCDELQAEIDAWEAESEQLRQEIAAKQHHLKEHKERTRSSRRHPRKSFIDEDMLSPDEANKDALFNEDAQSHRADTKMQRYVNRIETDASFVK
jgi:hypothetical protein